MNMKKTGILALVGLSASLLGAAPILAADLMLDPEMAPVVETAKDGWYVSLFTGGVWSDGDASITASSGPDYGFTFGMDMDMGYTLGLAVGTEVFEHLRGEVELSVIQSNPSGFLGYESEVDITSTGINLLGNLWYDIDTGSGFTPYVGGGLGVGYTELTADTSDSKISATGLVYQLGAGVKVAMTDSLALDLGYRYKVMPDAPVSIDNAPDNTDVTLDATSHVVQAGLTFTFD
jgi:opacity protein-like surface antigen